MTGGGLTLGPTATGTETLTGVNTYTGATTIDAGTLALSGTGSIASSSGVADNGTFDISGLTNGGTTITTLSGTGGVTLGANTLTLSNASSTFGGVISGTGGLTLTAGTESFRAQIPTPARPTSTAEGCSSPAASVRSRRQAAR